MSDAPPPPSETLRPSGPLPVVAPLAAPPSPRLRARLATLLLLGVVWVLPWFGSETGAAHAGAFGALAFAVAWGLAATLAAVRTRDGLGLGEALTSLSVAATAAALSASDHPWMRAGAGSASLVPIFVPLALLAALDAGLRARRPGTGREVTVLRAASATLAGGALAAGLRWVPAAAALAVGLLPAAAHLPRTVPRARVALEAASLVAAAGLLFARPLGAAIAGAAEPVEQPSVWVYAYNAMSVALGVIAAIGVFGSDDAEAPAGAPPER